MKNKIKLFFSNGLMLRIVLLLTVSLILYYTTCMKSPGWGDGSKFQLAAKKLYMNVSALSHPLYILISKMFYQIPFGSDTIKINSVSIISGIMTLFVLFNLLYLIFKTDSETFTGMTNNRTAQNLALLGSFLLMVSHTFWIHCIITEVYTLNAFIEILSFYFLVRYIINQNKKYFLLSVFITTFGLSNHLLCLWLYPALIYIFAADGLYKEKGFILKTIFVLFLGSTFLLGIFIKGIIDYGLYGSADMATGGPFRGILLHQNFSNIWGRLIRLLFFYIYQFSPLGFLLGLYGIIYFIFNIKKYSCRMKKIFVSFILAFLFHTMFGFLYNVSANFVFYLPAYLFFVIFIIYGAYAAANLFKLNKKIYISYIILSACLVLNISTYTFLRTKIQNILSEKIDLSEIANSFGALYNGRTNEDNIEYMLSPFKIKDYGSDTMKKYFMKHLDKNGIVLANWETWTTLMYFKITNPDTKTPEVQDVPVKEQILFIKNNIDKRPIYFGSTDPKFEIVNKLPKIYKLKSIGPFLKIEKVKE